MQTVRSREPGLYLAWTVVPLLASVLLVLAVFLDVARGLRVGLALVGLAAFLADIAVIAVVARRGRRRDIP